MLRFLAEARRFLAIAAAILFLRTCTAGISRQVDPIDPSKEFLVTDVEEIKAFFKLVDSQPPLDKIQQEKDQGSSARESRRAFFPGGNATQPAGAGSIGGLLVGGAGNLITAAGSLFGAAAAASQQAIAAQQAAAQQVITGAAQQPGASITMMTPAQQILNLRACPNFRTAVCAPAPQCLLAGGVSVGNCLMGLGVCCTQRQEIRQGCSATNNLVVIKDKLSTISSNSEDRTCQFEIYKADVNVCQLQLHFDSFQMDDPMWGESCSPDSVLKISDSVTTGGTEFPICGVLQNGTRLYLAYGRSSRITLSFFKAVTRNSYRIRIHQIDCNSPERIPDQCLQNHEGHSGLIKSFGFPQYMINHQKYTVCINAKAVSDNGRVTWRECSIREAGSDSENNFMMSEYFILDVPIENHNKSYYNDYAYNFYNTPDAGLFIPSEGSSCSKTSFVEVHGEDKHCGAKFMSSGKFARSESRPYMLTVNIVEDLAENLPDYAVYRIPGIRRNGTAGLPEILPENDCEHHGSDGSTGAVPIPSTQGFEPCNLLTKHKTGAVQYDLCLCSRKEGTNLPVKPKARPDLLERKGFCLHYSVT